MFNFKINYLGKNKLTKKFWKKFILCKHGIILKSSFTSVRMHMLISKTYDTNRTIIIHKK